MKELQQKRSSNADFSKSDSVSKSKKKKESGSKKRRKTFLTTYKTSDGLFAWEIKAYDFEEAEHICRLINHKLEGKKVFI